MTGRNLRFLCLLMAGSAVLAAGMGLRDPWPPDEPRFALVARDMAASGEWLIPSVGGVLYPDKPPLFFWLVAGLNVLTGSISVSLLLPAFLAGMGVLWLVHDLAGRLWNEQAGLWSAGTLLVTIQFTLQMKSGQIDGLLCFWTTLALYGFCRHLLLGPDWRWYAAAGLSCGMGVITKGVGFLPFLLLVPYAYARHAHWPLPYIKGSPLLWLLAPLMFLGPIALWLVPMVLVTSASADPALLQYRDNILLTQTVTRYADAWGHLKPPWYFLTNAIPFLWLPLSLLLPWLLPAWTKDLKAHKAATLLPGAWIILVVLFFSISGGKRSVYILPAVPALALLAGQHLPAILSNSGARRALFGLSLAIAALPIAIGGLLIAEPATLQSMLAGTELAASLPWIIMGSGIVGMALFLFLGIKQPASGFSVLMLVLWLSMSLLVYPRIDGQRSGKNIVSAATVALPAGHLLAFAGWKEQLLLQWNKPAVHFGYRREDGQEQSRDAAAWLAGDQRRSVLLPGTLIEPCFARANLKHLGFAHRQHWFLASEASLNSPCHHGREKSPAIHYDPGNPVALESLQLRTATGCPEREREVTSLPASPE